MSEEITKNPQRLKVLERIGEYEKNGWWSRDVEDDPPTIPLKPEQIDYLNEKLSNRIMNYFVNKKGAKFINGLLESGAMIIKDVRGFEHYQALANKSAVITCNHFNAFDNFAVWKVIEGELAKEKRCLWKVIREGNYTNYPGLYGLLFRHCNTLPLSANFSTMKKFMEAVRTLLARGDKILVYAEQGMWWNYRKPRPLTPGAFRFAAESNVPVIPFFICMEDTDKTDSDGFPVQAYTVFISEPIYPDAQKSVKEIIEEMRQKNYEAWKKTYEEFYGIPLAYQQ